jgi:acetyl-CoA C-acetyltransferase
MPREVYIAGVGLTKVDLTGRIFQNVFELFTDAYESALADSRIRAFDALQLGVMCSEEFEGRANIAAKVADRLGLTGVPAIRTETASSTGAAAFHEAWSKVASGQADNVLVLAGERMKMVTTAEATAIMSKTVDPVERSFGFTMPALIALVTQAWLRERRLRGSAVADVLSRLMWRAHTLGADNPLAAFHGRPEALESYFDRTRNFPVATPLLRKDCSPICDGAAAVILTSRPEAVKVAGLGCATDTSSILDRASLSTLAATRHAARVAYWRAGIANPRDLEGLLVESHDAFNSLLPINLGDLDLLDADEAVEALVGSLRRQPISPYANPTTGVGGRIPTNLSGGLKARGHPVGGTGLFQIAETYLQITDRFPNPAAQVANARVGLAHSVGGPGNNVYVTIVESSDSRRTRSEPAVPRLQYESPRKRPDETERTLPGGGSAVVEAVTSIHVTSGDVTPPVHVALLTIGGRRVFAKLDQPLEGDEPLEQILTGQKVRVLVKDDGDHYFQLPQSRGLDLGRITRALRRRVGPSEETKAG